MNARKTTTTLLGTFVLAGLLSAGVASGQPSSTSADYGYGPGYYVVYPRVYPAWGGTTVAGSYARGLAALTHAQGVYNRLTAEARLIHAQAQAKELENRELRIQSYFAMREHNRPNNSILPLVQSPGRWPCKARSLRSCARCSRPLLPTGRITAASRPNRSNKWSRPLKRCAWP